MGVANLFYSDGVFKLPAWESRPTQRIGPNVIGNLTLRVDLPREGLWLPFDVFNASDKETPVFVGETQIAIMQPGEKTRFTQQEDGAWKSEPFPS